MLLRLVTKCSYCTVKDISKGVRVDPYTFMLSSDGEDDDGVNMIVVFATARVWHIRFIGF